MATVVVVCVVFVLGVCVWCVLFVCACGMAACAGCGVWRVVCRRAANSSGRCGVSRCVPRNAPSCCVACARGTAHAVGRPHLPRGDAGRKKTGEAGTHEASGRLRLPRAGWHAHAAADDGVLAWVRREHEARVMGTEPQRRAQLVLAATQPEDSGA